MKVVFLNHLIFWLFIFFTSCQRKSVNDNSLLSNFNENGSIVLEGTETKILDGKIGSFSGISILDSMIIVHNNVPNPYYYDIYNRSTEQFIKSFGLNGSGPGEIVDYNILSVDYSTRRDFYVLVPNDEGKVLNYNINSLLSEQEYLPEVVAKLGFDIDAFVASNQAFWALSLFSEKRLLVISRDGNFNNSYLDFPEISGFEDHSRELLGMVFQGFIVAHPDKSQGAIFTYASPNIDIFSFNDSIKSDVRQHLSSPEVFDESRKISDDTYTSAISFSFKNEMAFLSVSATSRYIYTLYSGRSNEKFGSRKNQGNLVLVFDWYGQLEYKIKLDVDTDQIAVSNDDAYLYSLVEEETKNIIKSYQLPLR